MKKNYFFSALQEELDLLRKGILTGGMPELRTLTVRCSAVHEALCRRLFREFVVPLDRGDLFLISQGICRVFFGLSNLHGWGEENQETMMEAVGLFTPLPLGESALSVAARCQDLALSAARKESCLCPFFDGMRVLSEAFLVAALHNA